MKTSAGRRIILILCILVFLPLWAASAEGLRFSMAGFDGDESSHDWETNAFFSRMEARTGIGFTFDQYTDYAKWQAAKESMFREGPLPDVLFKAALTTQELLAYTDSGQIIDLRPLLEENAPQLWALLQSHPDWLAAITLPNGKIGALLGIHTLPAQNAMWINQRWLERVNLPMPGDAQSLKAALRAFLESDPNQNGKRDEIPFGFLGVWDLKFFSHAFGAVVNDYNIYLDEGGQVRFWPLEDGFFAMLGYLRELQSEKLLDPNGFYLSDAMRSSTEKDAPAIYGAFFGPNPLLLMTYERAKEYVLLPPLAYEGKQAYRELGAEITRGTFAITSACSDPAALLRWVDVLYTAEGAVEAMAGTEGIDYILGEDGRWQFAADLTNLGASALNELSVYDSGSMPWLFPLEFYNRFAEDGVININSELEKLTASLQKPFPDFQFTQEQGEEVLPLQNDLGKYVDEAFARFVLGQWELSPQAVAEFRQGLLERGAEKMIAFWQRMAATPAQP
ncbi:MAG: hypothetical protein VB099_03895 [Candidatus Limiplasma sp.]|nr:hypothetical protein [Candidatus Limiplasma sp.]